MTTKLLLFAAFVFSMLIMSVNHRKKRKKIVFFGDSITLQGSRGGGFIKRILQFLRIEGIDDKYELVGAGVNGNTVVDLYKRVDRSILSNGADVVVIYIGINDVWNKVDWVKKGIDVLEFEDCYGRIINKLLEASIKPVLCTLSVIGERLIGQNNQDEDLELYSEVVRKLATKYELPLVDLRKAFTNYIEENNIDNLDQGVLTADSVHLNNRGNELVAAEMWKVLQQVM